MLDLGVLRDRVSETAGFRTRCGPRPTAGEGTVRLETAETISVTRSPLACPGNPGDGAMHWPSATNGLVSSPARMTAVRVKALHVAFQV